MSHYSLYYTWIWAFSWEFTTLYIRTFVLCQNEALYKVSQILLLPQDSNIKTTFCTPYIPLYSIWASATGTFAFPWAHFFAQKNRWDSGHFFWTIKLSVLFITQAHQFHWRTVKEQPSRGFMTDYPVLKEAKHSKHWELPDQMRANMLIDRRNIFECFLPCRPRSADLIRECKKNMLPLCIVKQECSLVFVNFVFPSSERHMDLVLWHSNRIEKLPAQA